MKLSNSTPKADGFYMPAEFEPHDGTIVMFPDRPGSWRNDGLSVVDDFRELVCRIAQDERVYVLCNPRVKLRAEAALSNVQNVILTDIPQDDAWARDTAPTFVRNARGEVRGIDWKFNAWGGDVDGLYQDYAQDNAAASRICDHLAVDYYDAQHFVLEGGSIHSDGEGTILVTESCLLSAGRNPQMSKEQITAALCEYLGAEKVLWLPHGIFNDETNEHVDNVCCFLHLAEVALAWTDDPNDPQYAFSKADLDYLSTVTDAKGRHITVHKIPIPDHPVCVTVEDVESLVFAPEEDTREIGERLAASYVNFYFSNHQILLPAFGGENSDSDLRARDLLAKLCPDRVVQMIPASEFIRGGGNIHCLTQQIPKGVLK